MEGMQSILFYDKAKLRYINHEKGTLFNSEGDFYVAPKEYQSNGLIFAAVKIIKGNPTGY